MTALTSHYVAIVHELDFAIEALERKRLGDPKTHERLWLSLLSRRRCIKAILRNRMVLETQRVVDLAAWKSGNGAVTLLADERGKQAMGECA